MQEINEIVQDDFHQVWHNLWVRGLKLMNVILIAAPFALSWFFWYAERIVPPFYELGNWAVIGIFTALYFILCRVYNGFIISLNSITDIVYSQSLACAIANFFMYVIILLLAKNFVAFWPLLAALVLQVVVSAVWAILAQKVYFSNCRSLRTAVIWDMRETMQQHVENAGLEKRFDIRRKIHVMNCVENLEGSLRGMEAVFICGVHSHERNQIVKYCVNNGIRVYVIPRVGDVIMESAGSIQMFHLPMMMLERYNPSPAFLLVKRLFDIFASGLALIVLSPLMLVVALIIRSDGGTAFYRQKRLTKNRREFEVLKFRSMRMDAEKDGVARLSAGENDDRITPVGHFIRACRIDELPQLINILKGDMSIVGPRPERPEIAAQYEEEMPEFGLRLQAKAGLTGYAQVYGKYNTTPYNKLLMDLRYIAKPSLSEDLKIIFATIKILFLPESTEGIAEGQTTAMDGSFSDTKI